jgi:hypothetical protein
MNAHRQKSKAKQQTKGILWLTDVSLDSRAGARRQYLVTNTIFPEQQSQKVTTIKKCCSIRVTFIR